MRLSWKSELPPVLLLAGMFLLAAVSWPAAPDRIPVHWNVAGQVDRYGGKVEGLLLIPLLALGLYLLLLALPWIDPGRANYPHFAGAYQTIRLTLVVFLALVYGIVHLWIRGRQVAVGAWVPLLTGGLLVIFGNLMGKIRPNWFIGIRTPWTLSSKLAWMRTHRLGGWLLIGLGLLLMALAVVRAVWAIWLVVAAGLGFTLWAVVYSYLVWRTDPDKVPPAGTLPAEEP
ncbi:MAG: DUF1648 domain-containing protein [Armatimonadota bacterium]|nr:DUF1648 domain-containing protein [Armatimonadota bacterium]MDR7450371.1 DUF1648 domain-containing protein [Armatimonadota bacterium]MDR7467046.1 DUF1648 domain-containing protein [Armatimonadota bacterium]MDR7493412.1 DUF1648 domain-containing protein [Armatimonadota bacterium]MDR7498677.1 DUF1648 domain-containing protein [Armatimonadota bacterium]